MNLEAEDLLKQEKFYVKHSLFAILFYLFVNFYAAVCYSPSVNSKNSCDDDASPDSKTEAKEGKPIPAWKV
jgi:hypothetical protein